MTSSDMTSQTHSDAFVFNCFRKRRSACAQPFDERRSRNAPRSERTRAASLPVTWKMATTKTTTASRSERSSVLTKTRSQARQKVRVTRRDVMTSALTRRNMTSALTWSCVLQWTSTRRTRATMTSRRMRRNRRSWWKRSVCTTATKYVCPLTLLLKMSRSP